MVGKVKEKEKARKEYAKAVSEGHGAYLGIRNEGGKCSRVEKQD